MISKFFRIWLIVFVLLTVQSAIFAQPLRIAVAANAQGLIKKLQVDFKKRTGIETEAIVGASGKLTAQILSGAPYEIFLSADTEFPERLYAEGFGLRRPKVYALGSLIVCGSSKLDIKNWRVLMDGGQLSRIAVANPKTAPYGRAAMEALKFYVLESKVSARLVFGESISQVNTYIQSGAVGAGFTTESFLYENMDRSKLSWARVDEKSYGKIEQGALLLKYARKSGMQRALKFYDYLSSAGARKIISGNGYHLTKP
jgi:molybdate transport system substrate-binding protein